LLRCLRGEDWLIASATLGSFALGLTVIDVCDVILRLDGTEQLRINFAQSPGSAAAGAVCIMVMMVLIMAGFSLWRSRFDALDFNGAVQHARWLEQSEELEDGAFAIVAGFLMCQVATFGFRSILEPVALMPNLPEKSTPYKQLYVMVGLFAAWLIAACSIWSFKRLKVTNQVHRTEYLIVRTVSMFLTWCVLRWGQLVVLSAHGRWFGQQDPVMARLLMALCVTAGSLLLVLLVTLLVRESKEGGTPDFYAVSCSLGLLIGQVWMACFYRASLGFAHTAKQYSLPEGPIWETFIPVGLMLALLVLLVPMWKVYIVPHFVRKEHGAKETAATPAIDALLGMSSNSRLR